MSKAPKHIIVVEYDPAWPLIFQEMAAIYQRIVGTMVVDIQHVGSTSVPGLAAKPILDIDLILEDRSQLVELIPALENLGYSHRGDLGISERESFKALTPAAPQDGSGRTWMRHHLYACVQGHQSVRNHLALRNYLRAHPEAVQEYGQLKQALARQHPYDIDAYIAGKTPFIIGLLRKTGFSEEDLTDITNQNL